MMLHLFTLVMALTLTQTLAVDLTLVSKTHGLDVVEAATSKINLAQIFPADHNFVQRIAYIESQLGDDPSAFPPNFYGGIWQLTEAQFAQTKDTATYPFLRDFHAKISASFKINWSTTKWRDLLKPMHSVLAAHLYISTVVKGQPIPDVLLDQANLWFDQYNTVRDCSPCSKIASSVAEFVNEVTTWEESRKCTNAKIKVVVVMDESGSIGMADYTKALEFTATFLTTYNLTKASVGFMTYSTAPRIIFELDNGLSTVDINDQILNAGYVGEQTGTGDAILEAVQMFLRSMTEPGVPLIMVTFTDGQSNVGEPVATGVDEAQALGIDSYAVGITNNINMPELLEIAYGDATKVEVLTQYDALTDFFHQLNQITCKAEQTGQLNVAQEDDLAQGEKRYYNFQAPVGGASLGVNLEPIQGEALGYYSYKYKNPSAALYDGILWEGDNTIPAPSDGEQNVHITVEGMGDEVNEYILTTNLN